MIKKALQNICTILAWPPPTALLKAEINCAGFILMAIYLLILPIPHTIAIRHVAFFSLLLLTLWAAWQYRLKFHFPLVWPFFLYAIVALISVTYAIDPLYSLGEVKKEIGYGFIALILACTWVRSAKALEYMLVVLIVGSALMSGYSIINIIMQKPDLIHAPIQEGSFSGVGVFSTYLITVLPFIVAYIILIQKENKFRRAMLSVIVFIEIIALYLTGNRAGMMTITSEVLLALLLFIFYRGLPSIRILLMGIIIIVSSSILFVNLMHHRNTFFVPDPTAEKMLVSDDPRLPLWQGTIKNIYSHPFTGAGFGRESFKLHKSDFLNGYDGYWHAHNMFLNKGSQMGIPGIAAFVALLMAIVRAMWIPKNKGEVNSPAGMYALACIVMLAGVIVKNTTDDFFVHDSALLFWVLVGAVLGSLSGERNSIKNKVLA